MTKTNDSFLETIRKMMLYGANGIINTGGSYALFLLISFFIDYRIAIVLVYIIWVFPIYFLTGKIVFKSKGRFVPFLVIYVIMLLTNVAITWSLVEGVQLSKEIAQLIAVVIVFFVGFFLNRRYTFRIKNYDKD